MTGAVRYGAVRYAAGKKKRLGDGAKYSRKDVLALRELFDKHDLDHDGRVTVAELVEALEEDNSLPQYELSAFRSIDLNKDGILTFEEYLRRIFPLANEKEYAVMLFWGTPAKAREAPDPLFEPNAVELDEIKQMFKMYDKNRNGIIDVQELLALVEKCGYAGADVEEIFTQADTDMSGTISFDEFVQLVKHSYI